MVFYKEDFPDSYNAKSLILVDCSDDEIFVSKNENEPQIPASLAKLFVIEYASTLADLDSIVVADYGAISLTKPGSSVAQIKEKEYFLHNLFAAMLVPSGMTQLMWLLIIVEDYFRRKQKAVKSV